MGATVGRCILYINEEPAIRIRGPLLLRTHQPHDNDLVPYEKIMGAMATAAEVVAALEYKDEVKVHDRLVKHGMGDVDADLIPDVHVWKLLLCQTKANANAVTYVDFTCSELLPVHISAASIGGSTGATGESPFPLAPESTNGFVGMFSEDAPPVTAKPRFIRNVQQWQAIFDKYSVAAICCEQLTTSQALSHRHTVGRLHGQCVAEDINPFAAVLYDELVRREWHLKAIQCDTSWHIGSECKQVVPRLWTAAKAMADDVVMRCGILTGGQQGVPTSSIVTGDQRGEHASGRQTHASHTHSGPPGVLRDALQQQAQAVRERRERQHHLYIQNPVYKHPAPDTKEPATTHDTDKSNEIKDALNNIADNSSRGMSKRMKKSRRYIDWVKAVKKHNKGKEHMAGQPSVSSWT